MRNIIMSVKLEEIYCSNNKPRHLNKNINYLKFYYII